MSKSGVFYLLIIVLCANRVEAQSISDNGDHLFEFKQLQFDSLYESKQIVSILKIPLDNYTLGIAFDQAELKSTSSFAIETGASAAINAGFFNMKKGGSVTYLEVNDSIIATSGPKQLPNSLLNGVLILNKDNTVEIGIKKPDSTYQNSKLEKAVLGTGPVLLIDGKEAKMADKSFVSDRHPRTCLCITKNSLLLITVDGRSSQAFGMSLLELQELLIGFDCINAINLDGGGSTTMWISDMGIVNNPSDKSGERKVANVILIKELRE